MKTRVKNHIITVDKLRTRFLYDHKGIAQLNNYGAFERGLTRQEVDDYLRVRTNTMNIALVNKKFYKEMGCCTCPVEVVDGKEVYLIYRHDVKRYADLVLENIPTYFD